MTTLAPDDLAIVIGPPAPVILDGIAFVDIGADHETAWDGATQIGMLGINDVQNRSRGFKECVWRARVGTEEWRPMRSRAEARAYVVSAHRHVGILFPWHRGGVRA